MGWTKEEQPQSMTQWNRMMYQRDYRRRIKDYTESKEYREEVKANETIWIKKSNLIYGDKSCELPKTDEQTEKDIE